MSKSSSHEFNKLQFANDSSGTDRKSFNDFEARKKSFLFPSFRFIHLPLIFIFRFFYFSALSIHLANNILCLIFVFLSYQFRSVYSFWYLFICKFKYSSRIMELLGVINNLYFTSLRKKLRVNDFKCVLLNHSVWTMAFESTIHSFDFWLTESSRLTNLCEWIWTISLGRLQLLQLTICKKEIERIMSNAMKNYFSVTSH